MKLQLLGVAVLLAAVAPSQNEFEIYPGDNGAGTRFVRRGTFGAGAGAIFQHYPTSHFRGIGDDGQRCALTGAQFLIQDQDRRTQESWTLAVRRGDVGGPWPGPVGLIAGLPVQTPPDAASGGVAWEIALDVGSNPIVIPCAQPFFVGHQLAAAPSWPSGDGLAPWVYLYREDPHLVGRPNQAWQIVGNPDTDAPSQPDRQVINVALRTQTPTLSIGTLSDPTTHPGKRSPDFGPSGMYPDVSNAPGNAAHGLLFRVRDDANAGGTTVLLLGTAFDPPFRLSAFGIAGNLWMTSSLDGQMTYGDRLDSVGEAWVAPAWLGPGQLPRLANTGWPVLQAITYTSQGGQVSNVRVSNAVSVRL
jgi:hypothetical protein